VARIPRGTILAEPKSRYGDLRNYIGGKWIAATGDEWVEDTNPATASPIARVPLSSKEDLAAAIEAAQEAWPAWRETPPLDRARHLFVLRDLMERRAEDLARIVTQDNGKTIEEARGEIRRAIENVEVAAGIPSLMMGYGLEDGAGHGIDEEVLVQPLGVFAGISPFNFPVMVQSWFWPYAVATGNCWIAKPSEQDPVVWTVLVDLLEQAGFPPGVFNLVNGAKEAVEAICDHPGIAGVSFVGSTPIAKLVYARAASSGKRVQCGGGAKNLLVVLPDAKLDQAVPNIVSSIYGNAGERCLAGSVVVGLEDAHEPLLEKLARAATKIKVGYGLDETVEMGPVITRRHQERVEEFIETGAREGADLALDGRRIRVDGYGGYFVGPTVLDRVTPDMTVAKEEIFGPVASVFEMRDLDEAIEWINRSPYGNAASIFTSSGKAAREFRSRARAGSIGINVGVAAAMAYFPFGGMKNSFFGDLHPQGRDAVRFFTDSKVVITRWF
jgi:malonate-semialdehyde dehydrogenase (acetylating) / methylmalonate-semialdehyde dehydrogenase